MTDTRDLQANPVAESTRRVYGGHLTNLDLWLEGRGTTDERTGGGEPG